MENPKAFDKLGTIILPGAYIVYGHLLGRCGALRIGKVLSVESGRSFSPHGKGLERPWYKVIVRGVDDHGRDTLRLCSKDGTLLYPNRIIVLDWEMVPESYRNLLDTLEVSP